MRTILAVLSLALLAGCASPTQTPAAPTNPATATPTATPTPTEVTREEAGKRYLVIVAPINAARGRFEKKCGVDDRYVAEGGSTTKQESQIMRNLRACADDSARAGRAFAAALRRETWPAEARADVEKLARLTEAQAYAWEQIAQTQNQEAYIQAWNRMPPNDGSAGLVRARLGLPAPPKN